ncbi:MAG TPA: D-alanine--D-alanine ligase family protein [Terriglobia bacterium]|nr:D-alanine--D-alanine ligase family protein [Terriglobia bacterium]
MSKKIRVGVLFGGRSGEHDVSLTSAASVIKALDPSKYEVIAIGISREGHWHAVSRAVKSPAEVFKKNNRVIPSADPSDPDLVSLGSASRAQRKIGVDIVFPVLHGTFGEDGTVQGLLELAAIPYVGAGVLGSAVGMDKDVMKRLFRDAGLPVVEWVVVLRDEWGEESVRVRKLIEGGIAYPLFVKPANLGSSVGISKVHGRRELASALSLAARYDRKIIVEKALTAREIECSVLGNDSPEASLPGEVVSVNEFYDYEAKYVKEGSELIIPAKLTRNQTRRARELAVRAFRATDCAGMARVDFLLECPSGKLFVNEINTIPGFTPISMYPKLWEASGLAYPKLLDRLIALGLERHREKQRTRYTYKH